jgi:hypothetical protein
MEEESRQRLRARVNWPVTIQTEEDTIERVTYNISPDGAFIRGLSPLKLHEVIDMTISGPDPPIKVKAKVVWSSSQIPPDEAMPRGMGVEFIKISDEDRETISSLVSDYQVSTSSDEDEKAESLAEEEVKALVVEEEKEDKENPPQEPPRQCPRGHKHISWSADEDDIFCWDCNSRYPLAACLGPKDAGSPNNVGADE